MFIILYLLYLIPYCAQTLFYLSNGITGFLRGSAQYKPDFVVFLQHSKENYDIGVSEVKPAFNSNSSNNGESNKVKIGKEMAWILNSLVREGVEEPVVCGILVKGLTMTTFKMDLSHHQTYRMIEFSSVLLFENLQGISVLPTILRNTMQAKNIVKKTALKAKKQALAKPVQLRGVIKENPFQILNVKISHSKKEKTGGYYRKRKWI